VSERQRIEGRMRSTGGLGITVEERKGEKEKREGEEKKRGYYGVSTERTYLMVLSSSDEQSDESTTI
jgi:hypothetical protein